MMVKVNVDWLFSLHGGHSVEFCGHADSSIREIIQRAINLGMPVYGIAEHAPRKDDRFLYPEEMERGWTANTLMEHFYNYCKTVDILQTEYFDRIHLLKGLEIEVVPATEYVEFTKKLIREGNIEYIVGSIHWVNEYMTDYSRSAFERAVEAHHGLQNLILAYYNALTEMVKLLKPNIVAHFDLILCFLSPHEVPPYSKAVLDAIHKALEVIKENDCLLELNTSGLRKPIGRVFPDKTIIEWAKHKGISFTFGDDSHHSSQVGYGIELARELLLEVGITEVVRLNKKSPDSPLIREIISLQ